MISFAKPKNPWSHHVDAAIYVIQQYHRGNVKVTASHQDSAVDFLLTTGKILDASDLDFDTTKYDMGEKE